MFRKRKRGSHLDSEGLSRRAAEARAAGRLTLAQAAKQYGVTQRDLREWLGYRAEWHHELDPKTDRMKRVIYCDPLDDDELAEVRELAAERKARTKRQRQTPAGRGWWPICSVAGITIWSKGDNVRAGDNLRELTEDERGGYESFRREMREWAARRNHEHNNGG